MGLPIQEEGRYSHFSLFHDRFPLSRGENSSSSTSKRTAQPRVKSMPLTAKRETERAPLKSRGEKTSTMRDPISGRQARILPGRGLGRGVDGGRSFCPVTRSQPTERLERQATSGSSPTQTLRLHRFLFLRGLLVHNCCWRAGHLVCCLYEIVEPQIEVHCLDHCSSDRTFRSPQAHP